MEGTFAESMLDPIVRQKLVDSLGFCYEHTWESINLKLSDALGHAILFQDLLDDLMVKVEENERNAGNQHAISLKPTAVCPVCRIEQDVLERILDSIAVVLRDEGFITEFKQSNGLCIPHLMRLFPKLDRERQTAVVSHQRTCMESLKSELAEFIRKNDYRFRDEEIGKEGDSYKRSADMIYGKHRPADKKDLR
jgi:hypothetical protein